MVVKALTDTIHSLYVFVHIPTLARTIPHSVKRCTLRFVQLIINLKQTSITLCWSLRNIYMI